MAKIENIIPFILKWEGGYVHHKKDKGGATNKGVTYKTWEAYCKKKKKGKDASLTTLRKMTNAEWMEIFKTGYWDAWKADSIVSQRVANICVDWSWMSGIKVIKKVQKMLGLTADGIVGPKTLACINGHSEDALFGQIKELRKKYYENVVKKDPSQQIFLKGWLNRLEDLSRL
jgi:lysozyme family protein